MSLAQRVFSLFSTQVSEVAPPPGVRTIPCSALDLAGLHVVVTTGFIVDSRADAKTLEHTLSTLIEEKFPRAGARLARRNGVYEFQIPLAFDAKTPPVAFTVEDFPEPYQSGTRLELSMHVPDSSDATQPTIHPDPMPALVGYFKSKECPTTLEGFLVPNTPPIHVHVATFDDLTFIGVTSSHVTYDGVGLGTLLHAWTRLIGGEAIDAIPGMAWDMEPFATFTGSSVVVPQRGWFDLRGFSMLFFAVRFVMRILRDRKEATYLVRVPKVFLDQSKRDINDHPKVQDSGEWVGSSDVLMAWWLKTVYASRNIHDTTPIHIHLAVDLRNHCIFPGSSSLTTPYIHNAMLMIPVSPIPANMFRTESLEALALRIRRAILVYNANIDGIDADLHWRCANPLKTLLPCAADGEFSIQSNARKARFGELDFSGACTKKARVVSVLAEVTYSGRSVMRDAGMWLMEDEEAVWMIQGRGAKDWENIRRSGTVAFL